tara:strand:- start:382 stop:1185 length:804 start_codon:yes stop_codon:yes gene_type:complete
MNKIIFSLVLYKQSYDDIKNLIDDIDALRIITLKLNIQTLLYIFDNSPRPLLQLNSNKKNFIYYKFNQKNIGFGQGHNQNLLLRKRNLSNNIFIIVNPDIRFNSYELFDLLQRFAKSNDICTAPLIKNEFGEIQFSFKNNPTFLSLLIGRFQFIRGINYFDKYYKRHINYYKNYTSEKISSTYLSGCFLIIKSNIYYAVKGFDPNFFLHLEDADLSRKCSLYGNVTHDPSCTIIHKWARGSHNSIWQMLILLKSMIKYFRKWGFVLF